VEGPTEHARYSSLSKNAIPLPRYFIHTPSFRSYSTQRRSFSQPGRQAAYKIWLIFLIFICSLNEGDMKLILSTVFLFFRKKKTKPVFDDAIKEGLKDWTVTQPPLSGYRHRP
jgi:hypothetical protein